MQNMMRLERIAAFPRPSRFVLQALRLRRVRRILVVIGMIRGLACRWVEEAFV